MRSERGDIVVGWMLKVVVALAIFSVVAYDAISVGIANINAQDNAQSAALMASEEYFRTRNVNAAYQAAIDEAERHRAKVLLEGFRIDPDGRVHVKVEKKANTLFLHRVGATEDWTVIVAVSSGRSVPSS